MSSGVWAMVLFCWPSISLEEVSWRVRLGIFTANAALAVTGFSISVSIDTQRFGVDRIALAAGMIAVAYSLFAVAFFVGLKRDKA